MRGAGCSHLACRARHALGLFPSAGTGTGLLRQVYLAARHALLSPLAISRRHASVPQPCRKILVVRIDRIGDLVLSTPFLRNLRKHFPDAEIVLLARAFARDLLHDGALVDRIHVLDREPALSRERRALAAEAFDLAIDLHCDYPLETALLVRSARPACSVGFEIGGRGSLFDLPVPARGKKHFVEETFDILRVLGFEPRQVSPEVHIPPQAYDVARDMLGHQGVETRYAVLHPGGFYPEQRWPAPRFAQLADQTAGLGLRPVFIGGEGDRLLLEQIRGTMRVGPAVLCGQGIGVSAAAIARSALFIGNNSGPLHIACAFTVPSVSTMGPTDAVRFWPCSDRARVVRGRTVNEISVAEMLAAVTEVFPLGPRSAAAGRGPQPATTGQEEGPPEDRLG